MEEEKELYSVLIEFDANTGKYSTKMINVSHPENSIDVKFVCEACHTILTNVVKMLEEEQNEKKEQDVGYDTAIFNTKKDVN